MNPTTPDEPELIRFFPTIEDYLYISRCVTGDRAQPKGALYLYWIFLFLNVISFPAYLIFAGHPYVGLAIFAVSGAITLFVLPGNDRKVQQEMFEKIFSDQCKYPCFIELNATGIKCLHRGNESLIAWRNITAIQETADAIYFFQPSSGMAVRKCGFESDAHRSIFVETARQYIRSGRDAQLEPRQVSAISP